MAAPSFIIENLDHDGGLISTLDSVAGSLRWSYRMANQGGPGDFSCEVPLSHSELGLDDFAPYRTDWQLVMIADDGARLDEVAAGILGPVNIGSDAASGTYGPVRMQGADWLHFLEQPYPFDYDSTLAELLDDPVNLHKFWLGATQQTVITELLNSVAGYEDAVLLNPSFEGTGWSQTINDDIWFGDDRNILDIILDVGSLGSPYGFDMWVEPNGTLRLVSPRLSNPDSIPSALWTLNNSNAVVPPLDWTNLGPLATDTVVLGSGVGNTRSFSFKTYQPSRNTYRRWVKIRTASFTGSTWVGSSADAKGYQDRFPHKDLKITIRPDLVNTLDETDGFYNHLGEVVAVDYTISPYHRINASFWITGQEFYSPAGTDWHCDLTLSQIYATSGDPTP